MSFMYRNRAILTLSKYFVAVGHRQNIFNDENFLIYGSSKDMLETYSSKFGDVSSMFGELKIQ